MSAIIITPPANINTSLSTNRPAPERYGKPNWASPMFANDGNCLHAAGENGLWFERYRVAGGISQTQASFSKVFKDILGQPPGQYRRERQVSELGGRLAKEAG